MAVIAGAVIACAVAVFVGIVSEKYVYITELERPGAGRGRAYSVDVMYDGYVEELDIRIHERALEGAELEELYRAAGMELENVARGNNESFESVTQPLELTDRLDKYNMSVRWYIEDWNIIDYTGQIYQGSKLQKTHITAEMRTPEGLCHYLPYRDTKAPNAKKEFDKDIERLKKYISELL